MAIAARWPPAWRPSPTARRSSAHRTTWPSTAATSRSPRPRRQRDRWALSAVWPAFEELHRGHRQDRLASLILRRVLQDRATAIGFRAGRPRLEHLDHRPERVAGPHGPEPSHLVDARRAQARRGQHLRVGEQPEGQRDGVKAARDEATEDALPGRLDVEVKRLRVEPKR